MSGPVFKSAEEALNYLEPNPAAHHTHHMTPGFLCINCPFELHKLAVEKIRQDLAGAGQAQEGAGDGG